MEDRAHYVSFDIYVILLWISRRFCRSSIKPILTGVISKLTNNIKENLTSTLIPHSDHKHYYYKTTTTTRLRKLETSGSGVGL